MIRDSQQGFEFSRLNSLLLWSFSRQDKKIKINEIINYQWIWDIKMIWKLSQPSKPWTKEMVFIFFLYWFFPYCSQSSQLYNSKRSYSWISETYDQTSMNLTNAFILQVNFQITLGLMKPNVCVPLLNILHKNV